MLFLFFFQAEDGIRDLYVTGVQTCALPIWAKIPSATSCRGARAPARPRVVLRARRRTDRATVPPLPRAETSRGRATVLLASTRAGGRGRRRSGHRPAPARSPSRAAAPTALPRA